MKPFPNMGCDGGDAGCVAMQSLGVELAAVCGRFRAREGRFWLVVRSVEVDGGALPYGLALAGRVDWRPCQVTVRRVGESSLGEGAIKDVREVVGALPDLRVNARRGGASQGFERVVRDGVEGTSVVCWVADGATVYGVLELRFEAGREVRGRPESLQRLIRASAAMWRCLPIAGGSAVVAEDGTLEYATEHAMAAVELLGLPLRRLAGVAIDGPRSFDLGFAVAHAEPLRGANGPRILVRFEAPTRLSVDSASPLSTRQLEVARLAATGLRVRDIAAALGCAETTVKTHLRAAYAALGVASRVELLRALPDSAGDEP